MAENLRADTPILPGGIMMRNPIAQDPCHTPAKL
jgi:hypothetical protein